MTGRKTIVFKDDDGEVTVSICEIHDRLAEQGLHVIMTVERPGMSGRVVVDVAGDVRRQFGENKVSREGLVDIAVESAREIARGNLAADRIDEGRVAWLDLGRRMLDMPGATIGEKAAAYRQSIEIRKV